MESLTILPCVKQVVWGKNQGKVQKLTVSPQLQSNLWCALQTAFPHGFCQGEDINTVLVHKQTLAEEAYTIDVTENSVCIGYGTLKGAFYAAVTLKHIWLQYDHTLPCIFIEDAPDLAVRGILYDISRNKVPKLETLLQLVDLAANLKYNQLQLYIEGLSFEYDHYRNYLTEECYLTKQEIKQLEAYCSARMIDLVANQNTLGHMQDWLALEDFKQLCRNPEGEIAFGKHTPPASLNPENLQSVTLVEHMTQDILSVFQSEYYNVNLDESFGIEDGKLYAQWVNTMHHISKKHGRTMMMWSDMYNTYPQALEQLPSDVILLDWGYEDHYPFHMECKLLSESGHSFYVCAGTSAWCSIAGRTDNMLGNVDKAIACAHQYGATGFLMTEWGDAGHWQSFPIGFAGFVYGGARAWDKSIVLESALTDYLNAYVYQDSTNQMAQMTLALGRSNQYDDFRLVNGSFLHHHLKMGLCSLEKQQAYIDCMRNWMEPYVERFLEDGGAQILAQLRTVQTFDGNALMKHLETQRAVLKNVKPICPDATLLLEEWGQTIDLLEVSCILRQYVDDQETQSGEQ
ncbi:MAG: family 20 glycosylhydrolase, partial [Oscillospiraceae bacterium]